MAHAYSLSEMTTKDRSTLLVMLRRAWSRSTSADPEGWSEVNPAWGQCAVTSLVLQDLLGGTLCRTIVDGNSHYFNILDNGEEVDLTWEQFPFGATKTDRQPRERSFVLSFPDTARRYILLRTAVDLGPDRAKTQPGIGQLALQATSGSSPSSADSASTSSSTNARRSKAIERPSDQAPRSVS